MSRELKEITIGEENYTLGQWEPDFALKMLTRFIKMAGEPMAKMIIESGKLVEEAGGLDEEVSDAKMSSVVGSMLVSLGSRLDEDEVVKFFADAQEQILCKGKPTKSIYKAHFAGRIGHLMLVTKAQMQHQFSDFLELLPALKS